MGQQLKSRSTKHKKKKHRWKKIIGSVLLLFVLGIAGYVYSIYGHAKQTVNEKINTNIESIDTEVAQEKLEKKELINILLLGVDERDADGGRSDSIMIASLNPEDELTTVVSIPRDTLAEIAGKGFETKINHAYAYGGADMSVATVEKFLDLDLDYYVEINMEGLADLIDAIGGITVNNEIEWIDEGYYKKGYRWEKGEIELDGEKALGYVRMRHLDPNSDFGRTERQRKVINAIIDKGKNMATVLKLNSVIDVLGDNLQTNMTFDDMKKLLLDYNHLAKNFQGYMLQGEDVYIDGVYYYQVPDEELRNVHNALSGEGEFGQELGQGLEQETSGEREAFNQGHRSPVPIE